MTIGYLFFQFKTLKVSSTEKLMLIPTIAVMHKLLNSFSNNGVNGVPVKLMVLHAAVSMLVMTIVVCKHENEISNAQR